MKKSITFILSAVLAFATLGQCDNSYFPFKEGATFEQTSYNKKGKEEGRTVSTVTAIAGNEATVENKIYDKKGELITEGSYTIVCEENTIKFDFSNFVPEEMLSQYGDADVSIEGDLIALPGDLSVGQNLEDGSGKVIVDMSAMKMNMDMAMTERKVESKESITTKAGTFETFKITQNNTVDLKMAGISKSTESSSASWFAKGVGMVKTESYNKKGDLIGYTLLTSFNK